MFGTLFEDVKNHILCARGTSQFTFVDDLDEEWRVPYIWCIDCNSFDE